MNLYKDNSLFLSFIKEHRIILEDIYNKYIKDYNISKNDFFNFAFKNTSINNSIAELYKKYNNEH
jgi:hypothetical protein